MTSYHEYNRRGGWLAKLQEMFLPDFLSHMQPCQPKYCQERSQKNGEISDDPRSHFWPQITLNGPTAPPWDHFSFPKLGIYDFLIPCDHPACSKIIYKEVKKWPFWHHLGWFSLRAMAGILYLTNHWIFSPHSCCNDIYLKNKVKCNLMTWFGAVGGQI